MKGHGNDCGPFLIVYNALVTLFQRLTKMSQWKSFGHNFCFVNNVCAMFLFNIDSTHR